MSEQLKPWAIGDRIDAPCGHARPQAASQLHGVCVFCWRDRCGALEQYRRAPSLPALVAALEAAKAEWAREHPLNLDDPIGARAFDGGFLSGLTKAIEIVKEHSK